MLAGITGMLGFMNPSSPPHPSTKHVLQGLSNNDNARMKNVDGNLTAALDTKGISVTAGGRDDTLFFTFIAYC
jgi:hypothetical protein